MAVAGNDPPPPADDPSVIRDPHWFAEDYVHGDSSLSFVRVERDTIAAQTFLDQRWNRDGLARARLSLAALDDAIAAATPPPKLNFIWHTSFCCSTLMARALDMPGKNIALREPMILATVADVKRSGALAQGTVNARLPEFVFRLLARMPDPGAAVTVKSSNSPMFWCATRRSARRANRCSSIPTCRAFWPRSPRAGCSCANMRGACL